MPDAALDNLLAAFLAGPWHADALVRRAKAALGKSHRFVRPFVGRVLAAFPTPTHTDRLLALAAADTPLRIAWHQARPTIAKRFFPVPVMAPHPAAAGWPVPAVTTPAQLCDLLRIDPHHLDWLADRAGRNHRERSPKLWHYRHRWIAKPSGRARLLEIPKVMLKQVQRNILRHVLDRIPPHAAAHGFRGGRSIRTNAEPHAGRAVVVRFDLADFFPSVPAAAVTGVFRTAGYPPDIAAIFTGLCTTHLPTDVWNARPNPPADGSDWQQEQHLRGRHLPQGAPTSPALANLAAFRLDTRLDALAKSLDVTYTRYADDLAFSGGPDFAGRTHKFADAVGRIVRDEGFRLNAAKTRVMPQSGRQTVAGVVVNVRPAVPRADLDRLKAVLTNCLRHGPASQNRDGRPDFRAFLAGKLAHIAHLNPARGRTLLALFDRIVWPSADRLAQ